MNDDKTINTSTIRLVREDITLMDVDAFVFYARPDLKLGAGMGSAIAVRAGPSVQDELDKLGGASVTEAVVTTAGKLKAKNIIHAVGPAFQEEELESKLRDTALSVLKKAEETQVERLAIPAMGSGFYGVPPELCAKVTLNSVKQYLEGATKIKQVLFCLPDERDYKPFQAHLDSLV